MATTGKPWRADPPRGSADRADATDPAAGPSPLRRGGAADAAPDSDRTDPAGVLPDEPEQDVSDGFADGTVQEVDESAVADGSGPEDSTEVFDPRGDADPGHEAARYRLVVVAGPKAGARYDLDGREYTIGRGSDNRISIPDVSVSRRHARLAQAADGTLSITDLNSGNGTRLNDERIGTARLAHGDEIALGDTVMQVVQLGAPTVRKGKLVRAPAEPSGAVADAAAPTRGALPVVKPAAPAPARPGALATINPRRRRLYLYVGLCGLLLVALGVVKNLRKPPPVVEEEIAAEGGDEVAVEDLYEEGMNAARAHKWALAVQRFEQALQGGENEEISARLETAKFEAKQQAAVEEARKLAEKGDFLGARKLLAGVPERADAYEDARKALSGLPAALEKVVERARDLAKAGKKDEAKALVQNVLAAEPDHGGARGLLEELDRKPAPVAAAPKKPTVTVTPREPRDTPAPRGPGGPAVNAYLQGDLEGAIQAAESGDAALLRNLRLFRSNYIEGMRQAEAGRAPEAVRTLGTAMKVDRDIARDRPSKLGREVRRALADMEYQLGIDSRGDEQLPRAAQHYRAALVANPEHELARKQLERAYQRARDLYLQAYIGKSTDPDSARRLFNFVVQTLPADDETAVKAKNWYDKLGGG